MADWQLFLKQCFSCGLQCFQTNY